MVVFHGSNVIVENPELRIPNRTLDFGPGFYTTTNKKQAESFAYNVYLRNLKDGTNNNGQFISVYNVDYKTIEKELNILRFDSPNDLWFDFVWANRMEHYKGEKYDVVYGPVANDTIYKTFIAYEAGLYTREQTIELLKVRELYDQMTFATEKAISFLKYTGYSEVGQ